MKKLKLSLIAASAICAAAATALTMTTVAAADDYRDVTLTGTNVFYAGVGGAEISVARVSDDSEDGHTDYTSFEMGDGETVSFRKNLAYSWFAAGEDGFGAHNTFSMTIGFEDIAFESYVIRFQSQQYNITEDGVTENYLVFKPEGDSLNLYVSETEDIAEDEQASAVIDDYSSIEIAFGDYTDGNFTINVNGQAAGEFINVRGNYASYVSSGDSAATPITFTANFAEDAADDAQTVMIMYQLNGQSFEVFGAEADDDGGYSGGTVHDNCAPVVCLDSGVNYLTYGEAVDFDYTTIDVITSSPRTTVQYYVLTNEQFNSEDFNYNDTSEEADLFMEVTTSSDYKLLRDQYTYVPDLSASDGVVENGYGYSTYGLVKVCLYVRDTTSSRAQTDYVFLDWYVPAEYRMDIADIKGTEPAAGTSFIRIVEDKQGATYGDENVVDLDTYTAYIQSVEEEYQAKIDAYIAENYPDGLFASSDAQLYLPDFSGYVTDNLGGYTDLKYSIYYSSSSTGSSSALSYNELAMDISEPDVTYRFTIYVTDAAGNEMYYPDENGELQTISTDDIWEEDYADLLPFFEVEVYYRSATVEDPGIQSIGYVGSTYNSASFDITGVSGTYSTEYNLYIFDRDALFSETGVDLTYDEVVANIDALFFNTYEGVENTRRYFTLVTDDEQYEDYEWNSSNVTFVPQSPSEYYVVRLRLEDTGLSNQTTNSFLVVRASARANELYGEDNWLENNIASIVLFSLAGAFFIAFIVLLIVKPKDKGDIDEIAVQVSGGDNAKPSKDDKKGK